MIAYLDDASRFIVGYGIFDEATKEVHSILDDCINRYGKPLELLTNHGSQFYANFSGMKADGMSKFQQYLIDKNQSYTWKSTTSSN